VGRHLAAHLAQRGHEVHGFGRRPPPDWRGPWHTGDLTDAARVRAVVAESEPDIVLHLAGLMRGELDELLAVNVTGTDHLLAAVRTERAEARVLVTGSAAEYGLAYENELPITERQPLRPLGHYGVSKAAQSLLAAQTALRGELFVVRTRSFNLTGPGEPDTLVCAAFAKQLVDIEQGRRSPILRVGNLDSCRDFVDVRDAVRAYAVIAESGDQGAVYNVASGHATPIRDVLDQLCKLSGVDVGIEDEPSRRVAWDVPIQRGDGTRLRRELGWTPSIDVATSLADVLADWRARSAGAA
jgi:GDP-4-dehydro-6-deoxy-D-mannose reductase